jgi:hypothetical protein
LSNSVGGTADDDVPRVPGRDAVKCGRETVVMMRVVVPVVTALVMIVVGVFFMFM